MNEQQKPPAQWAGGYGLRGVCEISRIRFIRKPRRPFRLPELLSYFSAHIEIGDFMEYVIYDRGAKMIALGIILSLVFAIMHYASTGKERSERLYKSILDESAEALISSYERAGYEIETHSYEPIKASAISLEEHGENATHIVKEGIERESSINF